MCSTEYAAMCLIPVMNSSWWKILRAGSMLCKVWTLLLSKVVSSLCLTSHEMQESALSKSNSNSFQHNSLKFMKENFFYIPTGQRIHFNQPELWNFDMMNELTEKTKLDVRVLRMIFSRISTKWIYFTGWMTTVRIQ